MLEETEGDSDTVEAFNTDLRDLRSMHGNPPYKVLEERSYKLLGPNGGVGKTTLHNAVTDRALASERAVKALVMSLTGSPELTEQWIQRRSRLASAEAPHVVNVLEEPSTNSASSREGRTRRRRTAAFIAALVGTNVLTGLAVAALSGGPPANPDAAEATNTPTGPNIAASTGADPGRTPCLADARVATTNAAAADTNFLLELIWSPACDAGWGRITRSDSKGMGNTVTVTIFRRADPDGSTRQTAVEPDVNSAYSTLIVRSDPTDRLCVVGSISTDGVDSPEALPICA